MVSLVAQNVSGEVCPSTDVSPRSDLSTRGHSESASSATYSISISSGAVATMRATGFGHLASAVAPSLSECWLGSCTTKVW